MGTISDLAVHHFWIDWYPGGFAEFVVVGLSDSDEGLTAELVRALPMSQ
jgi:hypothetical protein